MKKALLLLFFLGIHGLFAKDPALPFIENKGQWAEPVLFRMDQGSASMFLEKNGFTYALYGGQACHGPACGHQHHGSGQGHAIKVRFEGSSPEAKAVGTGSGPERYNYYLGNDRSRWASGLMGHRQVLYEGLYEGISLDVYSQGGQVKYDFLLAPLADPGQVVLSYAGADSIWLDNKGNLHLLTSVGEMMEMAPIAYQEVEGEKVAVACRFELKGRKLSFRFPEGYDSRSGLVIDPSLVFSTYSGATSGNWGFTATYDLAGNGYGGGIIFRQGYPATPGAFQAAFQGGRQDVTLSKFSPDGSQLIFATYLGGSDSEQPHSMVCGPYQELYVYGRTFSTDFPTSLQAYDTTHNGGSDLFITQLDSLGRLVGSTYLGGTNDDGFIGRGGFFGPASPLYFNYGDDARGEITLDDRGNCYIATVTASQDFPIATLPVQSFSGGLDACVAKLSPQLDQLLWSSYFGGSQDDAVYGIEVASEDQLYLTGATASNDFPVTPQAAISLPPGDVDAFAALLDLEQSAIVASTFLGTDSLDLAFFIERDKQGAIYVFGQTQGNMPILGNPYHNLGAKQFITKLDPSLTSLEWQAPFGTTGAINPDLSPTAFLVDNCSRIYVAGWGPSNFGSFQGNLPLTPDAMQAVTDSSHFYFAIFEQDMDSLVYATYFGEIGGQDEHVDGGTSRFDKRGVIYQAVCASCGGTSNFPTTPTAYSPLNGNGTPTGWQGGSCNMVLFKIDFQLPTVDADFIPEDEAQKALFRGCAPLTVNFNNTSTRLDSTTFSWDFGDGSPGSSQATPQHTFSQPGTYSVRLIVSDSAACNQSDTVFKEIEVFETSFADAGPDFEVCQGQEVVIQATATGGGTFSWSPAAGLSATNVLQPIARPAQTITYYLNASDQDQCAFTDSLTIMVYPQTRLQAIGDTFICEGGEVLLWASGASIYRWSPADGLSNSFSATPRARPDTTTTYRLIGDAGTECPDTVFVQVEVLDRPEVQVSADRNLLCFRHLVNLTASGAQTYRWSHGREGAMVEGYPRDTTVYSVVGYNGPCPSEPATVQVNVLPIPVASFTALHESNYTPVIVDLENTSRHANRYLWDFGDGGPRSELFEPSRTYRDSGTYTIKLRAFNELGCWGDTSYTFRAERTWLKVPSAFSPNQDGFNDEFYIPSQGLERITFSVFNRWGRLVYQTEQPDFRWDGTHKGQAVPEGVYVYSLRAIGENDRLYEQEGTITIVR
jgi:gliding motility-associated-like protein